MRTLHPDPFPERRPERRARHGRADRVSRARRVAVRVRRGGRVRPRGRPGVAGHARPRHERSRNAALYYGDRGPGQPAPGHHRDQAGRARAYSTRHALCAYITSSFEKDNPEALVKGTEGLYKALGLMPAGRRSAQALHRAAHAARSRACTTTRPRRCTSSRTRASIGPAEKITYAHEYTHALQDQRFTLRDITGDAKDQGDRGLARTTLVEGDATLLMSLWAQQHLTPAELAQVATAVDPASEAILAKMPAILRETLLFPYTQGLQLTLGAFQQGGYAGVDQLFANPPDTTRAAPPRRQARRARAGGRGGVPGGPRRAASATAGRSRSRTRSASTS